MANMKLVKGARYRVLIAQYKNPFAGVPGVSPTCSVRLGHHVSAGHGASAVQTRKLQQGEVITYLGSRTGWGSDPGIEEWFMTDDGFDGNFEPAGIWGGIDDRLLQPE